MEFNIQELFDRHEKFKLKWLQLTDEDLFDWIRLQDDMITMVWDMKSKYLENKLKIEKDKGLKVLELKNERDEEWKKFTEKWIEAVIKQEFFQDDLDQNVLKTSYELVWDKLKTITEFVNIVKMNKKWSLSM